MTTVAYVSQKSMERQTGFRKALGYALPKEDKILIRKDLPKDIEIKVKQHEEEHILKGEEGPGLFDFIGDIFASKKQAKSADKATKAQTQAAQDQIRFAEESRDLARGDQAPYREAGYTALDALMSMTGLGGGGGGGAVAPQAPRAIRGQDYLRGLGGGGGGGRGRRMQLRNEGGPLYNVNELGPERVFQNGSYTRSNQPMTIPPNPTGYVAPNIQGRAYGGFTRDNRQVPPTGWGGPQQQIPGGSSAPPTPYGDTPPTRWMENNQRGPAQQLYGGTGPQVMNAPPMPGPNDDLGGGRTMNNTGWGGHYGGTGSGGLSGAVGVGQSGIAPFGNQGYADGGAPQENPGGVEGGYNFMTDPGYNFRIGEGQRAIERGAAAAGGLLSGGYGRRLTRYAQDYASNEYTNVYNRISNIAGLGQVAGAQSGNAAMMAGGQMGNAASNAGAARASGYAAQGDIWGRAIGAAGGAAQDWWDKRQQQNAIDADIYGMLDDPGLF